MLNVIRRRKETEQVPIIKIRGHEVDVDLEAELADYDWGYNAKWASDKLIASSPFRYDSSPSFFLNLTGDYAGAWGDSGAIDDEYVSGGFVKLLSYLRGEGESETGDYLLAEYGRLYAIEEGEEIRLPEIRLNETATHRAISSETVTQATSPYLTRRGISAGTQRAYGVGYNEQHVGFTAIPWFTADGRMANVKYRSTKGKRFFYEKDATPIRSLVYGLSVINAQSAETAVLCEGEIDAMSWASAGVPAVACGGSSISNEQIDAIKRSSIRRLLVGGDNDPAGQRLNAEVARKLSGHVELYYVDYESCNDANEFLKAHGIEGLRILEELTVSKLRVNCLQLCNDTVI